MIVTDGEGREVPDGAPRSCLFINGTPRLDPPCTVSSAARRPRPDPPRSERALNRTHSHKIQPTVTLNSTHFLPGPIVDISEGKDVLKSVSHSLFLDEHHLRQPGCACALTPHSRRGINRSLPPPERRDWLSTSSSSPEVTHRAKHVGRT